MADDDASSKEAKAARKAQKKAKRLAKQQAAAEEADAVEQGPDEKQAKKGKRKSDKGNDAQPGPSGSSTGAAATSEAEAAPEGVSDEAAAKAERKRLKKEAKKAAKPEEDEEEDEPAVAASEKKKRKKDKHAAEDAVTSDKTAAKAARKAAKGKGKEKEVLEKDDVVEQVAKKEKGKGKEVLEKDDVVEQVANKEKGKGKEVVEEAAAPAMSTRKTAPKSKKVVGSTATPRTDYSKTTAAELLSTKWLTPKALQEAADEMGFEVKKGKFSEGEKEAVESALEDFADTHDLTSDQLKELIFTKRPAKSDHPLAKDFWSTIAVSVPFRPLVAVYKSVQRTHAPDAYKGPWTESEIADLRAAKKECGNSWVKIAKKVGRTSADCRDCWRTIGAGADDRSVGAWSAEEVLALEKAVKKYKENWVAVAKAVKGRSPKVVMEKWISLHPVGAGGKVDNARSDDDAAATPEHPKTQRNLLRATLVNAIASLRPHPTDRSEIDFRQLVTLPTTPDSIKSQSHASLRKTWKIMCEKSGEESFADQLAWLQKRYPTGGKYVPTKEWKRLQKAEEKKNAPPAPAKEKGTKRKRAEESERPAKRQKAATKEKADKKQKGKEKEKVEKVQLSAEFVDSDDDA
ncbi:hypothetical protein MNV49_002232 [Pseudohyphozyma bogoriensis]|nr:hypothetical protein MNV49_002232 [Pseudohyphozyma bogoriensis]